MSAFMYKSLQKKLFGFRNAKLKYAENKKFSYFFIESEFQFRFHDRLLISSNKFKLKLDTLNLVFDDLSLLYFHNLSLV
jgi:hypothetical protein